MSLGSYPAVGNHGYRNVTLPETVLAKLPLVKNVIPARFSLFVALFAAVVLAVALDRLHATRPWGWSGRLATVVPLVAVSYTHLLRMRCGQGQPLAEGILDGREAAVGAHHEVAPIFRAAVKIRRGGHWGCHQHRLRRGAREG